MNAVEDVGMPIVFTYPNADTQGRCLIERIRDFTNRSPRATLVVNLGTTRYFSLMSYAAAMVGNSSSGIVEAASFCLPVVNVGDRQRGRIHGHNVIDVPCERAAIRDAIIHATSVEFRKQIAGLRNLYGDGNAAGKIVDTLKSVTLDNNLIMKRFYNQPDTI